LRRLVGEIERSGFEFGMRPESFEPLIRSLERLANRIVLGILAAAHRRSSDSAFSLPAASVGELGAVMFAVGFFFAIALGIYLT
jgi:hypothetical protein